MTESADLNEKASALGRVLTTFQVAANAGMPALALQGVVTIAHRLAGELIDELGKVPPGTVVHVNPRLRDGTESILQDYLYGNPEAPDTIPDDLEDM